MYQNSQEELQKTNNTIAWDCTNNNAQLLKQKNAEVMLRRRRLSAAINCCAYLLHQTLLRILLKQNTALLSYVS